METDLYHYFGGDISASPTGDLLPVSSVERGQQRILRRLLTNPGQYIFHPEYGAGLPAKVGSLLDVKAIQALVTSQILLEAVVSKTPAPVVTVREITGGITVTIQYTDAVQKTPTVLSFDINR